MWRFKQLLFATLIMLLPFCGCGFVWRADHRKADSKQTQSRTQQTTQQMWQEAGAKRNLQLDQRALHRVVQQEFKDKPLEQKPRAIPKRVRTPPNAQTLTEADLRHGQRQTECMIHDRSVMAQWVKRGDSMWNWTARQFAGEVLGERIYWNNGPMTDKALEYVSDNQYPDRGRGAWIRLREKDRDGKPISGEELWAYAVFELYNIRSARDFNRVYQAALTGTMTEDEFVYRNAAIEFSAEKKVKDFYRDHWRPFARKKQLMTDSYYWFVSSPDTYEQWISQYKDRSSYPWSYWGKFYEEKVVPYRRELGAYKRAKAQWNGIWAFVTSFGHNK